MTSDKVKLLLLVIEDLESDFELLSRLLTQEGFELQAERVETASSLQKALLDHDWDIIISDFNLPQLNAFGALRIVREARPDTPFIVVSGSIGEEQAVELMRAGATDFLTKDRLTRLPSVILRELGATELRAERRKLERQLQHLQKVEALGMLAGGVAHNFRNVLMAIDGLGSMVADQIGPDHLAQSDLQQLLQTAKRSGSLVDRLMAFSRQQEDRPPQRFDLYDTVKNAAEMLRSTLPSFISLHCEGHAGRCICIGQPHELEQIVVNMVNNSAHSIGQRAGRIDIRLGLTSVDGEHPGLIAPGRYSIIEVRDNGEGMPAEVRARMFEPFFTTKPEGLGTGLGLPMAHNIVTNMGGAITCESTVGMGTTLRIHLPAVESELLQSAAAPVRIELTRPGHGEHIMLVDDEQIIVTLTAALLTQAGYKVSKFYDPNSALTAFQTNPQGYDLLLTDLAMPGMTGLDLARAARALRPDLPVIVSTGYGGMSETELFGDCDVVLPKPCTRQELYEATQTLLCKRVGLA